MFLFLLKVTLLRRRKRNSEEEEGEDLSQYAAYVDNYKKEIIITTGPLETTNGQSAPDEGGIPDYDMEDLANELMANSSQFDLLLTAKVKALLLNDTGITSLWQAMYGLVQKMAKIESTTTPPPPVTTTSNYLNSNVAVNNKINNLLNKLLELQAQNSIQYKQLLNSKKPLEELTFHLDSDVDVQVKDVFARLAFLSKLYNISFKDFYRELN